MKTNAPVRWVTHGLNGTFIVGGSYLGSRYAPLPLSWPVAHAGAWIVSHAMSSVRDALVDNLRAVFPHESERQLRRRAYRTCHTYTDDWMDFMRSLSWSRAKVLERFSYEHADRLTDALSLGRGAILVTGHFGNWEAGAVLMKALEVPLTVVAMPEPDPTVNWIRHRVRKELQADTIEVRQSLDTPLQIRRRLAEGHTVAMLMDRHVDRDRVPVTMLGRRAHFLGAPALLSYLTGAPLVPIFLVREGRGRFRARPQEPIVVDRTGNRDDQVQRAAQRVATLLEREIEARPDCWYQFYRYWDTSMISAAAGTSIGQGGHEPTDGGGERPTFNAERRTPDAERSTFNAERRTPNAECGTPNRGGGGASDADDAGRAGLSQPGVETTVVAGPPVAEPRVATPGAAAPAPGSRVSR